MRARWLPFTVLAACGSAPEPVASYAPVTAPCVFNRISTVEVRGAPRDSVPQVTVLEGTIDEPDRTERAARLALRNLKAQGYAGARLTLDRRDRCGVGLDVTVALGPRYTISAIAFETPFGGAGEPAGAPPELVLAARRAVLEDSLGTVNTVGGVYIEYRLRRALIEIERRYRDAGWLDATVGTPRPRYLADGTVALAIPLDPGPRFRIGSVVAVGASAPARAAALHSLGLRSGDYYDGPSIRLAIDRARKQLDREVELRTNLAGDTPRIDIQAIVGSRGAP
ncbi:MAG TPA: hypothetical protein VGC42_22690 [Kofleriaceae bacterium]